LSTPAIVRKAMEKKDILRELSETELDHVTGGAITEQHSAPGNGNVVPGGGGGLDTENVNPSGSAPPGQNK
jgi:bacteriocin-like protein